MQAHHNSCMVISGLVSRAEIKPLQTLWSWEHLFCCTGVTIHSCRLNFCRFSNTWEWVSIDTTSAVSFKNQGLVVEQCQKPEAIDQWVILTVVGSSWEPALLSHSWDHPQAQTWCRLHIRATRLSSATLQDQIEPETGSSSEVQGFAVVHSGYQIPVLHHDSLNTRF